MVLILQLLAFRSRSLFQKCRAPFVDEPRRFFLAVTKMEAAYEPWIGILDLCQSQDGMRRVELLDLLQCLGTRACFWKVAQARKCWLHKILHRLFPMQLIYI